MSDELDDVFADETKEPLEALDTWNRWQKPWAPFKRWAQLSDEERRQVWQVHDAMAWMKSGAKPPKGRTACP
jgi:hypothetical protein